MSLFFMLLKKRSTIKCVNLWELSTVFILMVSFLSLQQILFTQTKYFLLLVSSVDSIVICLQISCGLPELSLLHSVRLCCAFISLQVSIYVRVLHSVIELVFVFPLFLTLTSLKFWNFLDLCGYICSLSALIENKIFSVHGGLSPAISTLDQVW